MSITWKLGWISSISYLLRFGCLVLSSIIVMGCQTYPPPQRPYKPNPAEASVRQTDLRIAVVEFEDVSGPGPQANASIWTSLLLLMLPGVPYVHLGNNAQEPYPVGMCLAEELNSSKQYKSVDYYHDWSQIAQKRTEYDFLVTGSALYDRKHWYTTYFALGAPGAYIVMAGPPNLWVERDASFEAQVIRPDNPHKPIWTETISFEDSMKVWAPTMTGYGLENRDVFSPCPPEVVAPKLLNMRTKLYEAITSATIAQPVLSK